MRPENERMRAFLASNDINCTPKYMATGIMKRTWRLYSNGARWTNELAGKLNALGFVGYDNNPLNEFSGNGGLFSVFVRGHYDPCSEK